MISSAVQVVYGIAITKRQILNLFNIDSIDQVVPLLPGKLQLYSYPCNSSWFLIGIPIKRLSLQQLSSRPCTLNSVTDVSYDMELELINFCNEYRELKLKPQMHLLLDPNYS